MGTIRDFFRYLKAARVARDGRKALHGGRCDEGREALCEALALLGPEQPRDSNVGVWFSERVTVLRDLSIAAAEVGDVTQATESIVEGAALWKRMALPPSPKYQSIQERLAWGDAYLRKHRSS